MPRGRSAGYALQREQILAIAAGLFARQGYPGTSMNDVAAACGVSKAALYHYVDKYQLLVEITQGHVDRLRQLVGETAALAPVVSPEALLRALIGRFMQAYADAQAAHRVLTEDIKFLRPDDRVRVVAAQREVVDAFARAITAARPELAGVGLTRPVTMLLFGMMNWMFTWLRPGGTLDHAALTPVVTELFLGGLGAVQVSGVQSSGPRAAPATVRRRPAPARGAPRATARSTNPVP